jgi:hypothetical protein
MNAKDWVQLVEATLRPLANPEKAVPMLYTYPEREFPYIATAVLRKGAKQLPATAIADLKTFVQTASCLRDVSHTPVVGCQASPLGPSRSPEVRLRDVRSPGR